MYLVNNTHATVFLNVNATWGNSSVSKYTHNSYSSMQIPDAIQHVVRVCGGCGVLDLNGPEVDCLLSQWGGFAPYWGPRGALIQYLIYAKKLKHPK